MTHAVLEAFGLQKSYRRDRRTLHPLRDVDLTLRPGAVEAVVGPSGVGKSTLARCLTLLERPDEGRLRVEGVDPWAADADELRGLRRRCQLLPQEPGRAVSPRWSVERAITEPLETPSSKLSRRERRERAGRLLAAAELDVPLTRRARDLSGGQLQRLVIARALACEPRLMVLDETLTGLDLSLQAKLSERLLALREERGLALLLISHDLPLMRHLADRVWRLEDGRLVALRSEDASADTADTATDHA